MISPSEWQIPAFAGRAGLSLAALAAVHGLFQFSVFLILAMQLHHTGYIVNNAKDPAGIDADLQLIHSAFDPLQDANICLYKSLEGNLIELIQPLNENSPAWNFLQKKGEGFHHKCYEASSEEIEKYLASNRSIKIMGPLPAKIFHDRQVVFYITDNMLVEFII